MAKDNVDTAELQNTKFAGPSLMDVDFERSEHLSLALKEEKSEEKLEPSPNQTRRPLFDYRNVDIERFEYTPEHTVYSYDEELEEGEDEPRTPRTSSVVRKKWNKLISIFLEKGMGGIHFLLGLEGEGKKIIQL